MDSIMGWDLISTHNSGCRNKNEDAHFLNWARGKMMSTRKQSLVRSDCNRVVQQHRKVPWVRSGSDFVSATVSVNTGIHPPHSKAEWEGSTPCSPVNWNQVHHAHFDAPLLKTDVMACYGIHFHWTSTWFDIVGRGEKMCTDQQKLKLEPVFLCHYFCDLDKTSTFEKVQYQQLLATSTVHATLWALLPANKQKSTLLPLSDTRLWKLLVQINTFAQTKTEHTTAVQQSSSHALSGAKKQSNSKAARKP